jgi:glutathione synthase/RimK-type ligase-like ATP-grasp enzyme
MQTKTLFLTNRDDLSVEYLIEKFRQKTDQYLRINSEDLGLLEFDVDPAGTIGCTVEGQFYDLTNIRSVLFKRVPSKFNTPLNDEDRPYLNNERKHFLEGLYLTFSDAKWVNPMFATHTAERKIYQLFTAGRLGLDTPRSIVTNKYSKAIQFLQQNTSAIIKPVSNGLQVVKDATYSIYTTDITAEIFASLELSAVFETPVYLQEKIANAADIRVTIVGRHIFAVRITKEGDEVDWRKPDIIKQYAVINLPDKLQTQLLELNKFFGMVYSAIDLILTPEGKYIFLEINPVGEWVWLEHELGIDISGKLIQELL